MRTLDRKLLFAISLLLGLPVLLGLALSVTEEGQSEVQVAERAIQWPETLGGMPVVVADLAVDADGVVWFPVLQPPDHQGERNTNLLRGYDPVSRTSHDIALPPDDIGAISAVLEVGKGSRAGRVLIAWGASLLEVETLTGAVNRVELPFDMRKVEAGPEPPTTAIFDVMADQEGTLWVSRDHYPYLTAVYADGSSEEFALPEEAGSPERLAVDGQGRIWATLIRHQPFSNGPNLPPANAYRLTLRFDPATEETELLPIESWNIAGEGGTIVALAGDAPAYVQRLDGPAPVELSQFGPAVPGDPMTVGPTGDVWYRSRSIPGLVRIDGSGNVLSFRLPKREVARDSRFGGDCVSIAGTSHRCDDNQITEVHTPVLAIAAAPDGSAWFSTGDRIGHAIP